MDRILKNLDKINPAFARPNSFCAISAVVPFFLSGFNIILALDAAPSLEFYKNPLCVICCVICAVSAMMMLIPRILKWNWNVGYFGVSIIYLGSVALIGGIPWGCVVLYSVLPPVFRFCSFFFYMVLLLWWCKRFLDIYHKILNVDKDKFGIYREEIDAFYYLQKVDIKVLEEKWKFKQFPRPLVTVFFISAAFAMIPFSNYLKAGVGLPFTHIFLAVFAIPTDMLAAGLMTRGIIIFYYKPLSIFLKTGKSVYIDMASV